MNMKVITNVRLSRDIVSQLDQLVNKNLFSSRSDAIRVFCREYIRENTRQEQPTAHPVLQEYRNKTGRAMLAAKYNSKTTKRQS